MVLATAKAIAGALSVLGNGKLLSRGNTAHRNLYFEFKPYRQWLSCASFAYDYTIGMLMLSKLDNSRQKL